MPVNDTCAQCGDEGERPEQISRRRALSRVSMALGAVSAALVAWPVGAQFTGASDWWQDPAGYVQAIIERLGAMWPLVAPTIDTLFAGEPQVSDA